LVFLFFFVPIEERKMFIYNYKYMHLFRKLFEFEEKIKILYNSTLAGGVPTVDTKMFITINASF
jgi:hypothetical protein